MSPSTLQVDATESQYLLRDNYEFYQVQLPGLHTTLALFIVQLLCEGPKEVLPTFPLSNVGLFLTTADFLALASKHQLYE